MIKRFSAIISLIALMCLFISVPALAQEDSSDYISWYSASLNQGYTSGQLRVNYSITGTSTMDSIGVYKIVVYYSSGTKYQTIWGTTSNGLLKQNRASVTDVYTLSLTSGISYYCEVTLYAGKGGGSDTRTVTTGTVTAP